MATKSSVEKAKEIARYAEEDKPNLKIDPVDPKHYQAYFIDPIFSLELQWLETMCRSGRFLKNPEEFKSAVELQIRKYLDRNGGKDKELQELMKALWYMKFLVAFIANNNKPIMVSDIESLLKKAKDNA
jgi:hypothetical protein